MLGMIIERIQMIQQIMQSKNIWHSGEYKRRQLIAHIKHKRNTNKIILHMITQRMQRRKQRRSTHTHDAHKDITKGACNESAEEDHIHKANTRVTYTGCRGECKGEAHTRIQ